MGTGKVKEWKGAFGWIMPDAKIAHPGAQKHGGKISLAHQDVEAELSGVGATVSFFVYADGNGLGAMNVRPGTASKSAAPAQKPQATGTSLAMATKLKAAAAKMATATKAATTLKGPQKPGGKQKTGS